jgi:hypothetical protein
MAHLFNRFCAPCFSEISIAPIIEHTIMQPILIDGCHFTAQSTVQIVNDFRIALHGDILASSSARLILYGTGAAIIVAALFARLFHEMRDGARATTALRRLAKRSKHVSHTIWGAGALQAIPHLLFADHIAGADYHHGPRLSCARATHEESTKLMQIGISLSEQLMRDHGCACCQ